MPGREDKEQGLEKEEKEISPAPTKETIAMDDPSEYRPELEGMVIGKDQESFRGFYEADNARYTQVRDTYLQMYSNQSVDFVKEKIEKWGRLDHNRLTIMEAVKKMDELVDESDPDISLPNSIHAFQTAERIREVHPDKDWFHLVGLVHDLGKMVALYGEPQYAAVGDTFPVGCALSNKCVFHEFYKHNPDYNNPAYNTKFGMYSPNCGLSEVLMSFGHDEYMYRVLVGNNTTLPEEALYMVRYHSFYPWHSGGDYDFLCNDRDREMLCWIREFNKFDLYSKADAVPDVEALKPYYQMLIDKYIPGVLNW